jgi:hypothetical protein
VRSCGRACPASALPPFHSFEFGPLIDLDDTVNLSVRVQMILSFVLFLAVHEDSCDTEKICLGFWKADPGTPIPRAINFNCSAPTLILFNSISHILAEIFVIRVPGPVVSVQMLFDVLSWGPESCQSGANCSASIMTYKFLTSAKNSEHRCTKAFAVGYLSRSTSSRSSPKVVGRSSRVMLAVQFGVI